MRSSGKTYMGAATVNHGATRATPLRVYSAQVALKTRSTSRAVAAGLVFYDGNHKQLSSVTGQSIPDVRDRWRATPPVVGIAPPKAAYVVVNVIVASAPKGEVHYLTKPSLTVASRPHRAVTTAHALSARERVNACTNQTAASPELWRVSPNPRAMTNASR